MTTASPRFLAESRVRTARRYAEADIRGIARPAEVAWLYENPLMWLRALHRMHLDVQNRIAQDRKDLSQLKPGPGERVTSDYLNAKRDFDARARRRLHFQRLVEGRMDEVKALIDPRPIGPYLIIGDLVDAFTEISEMADAGDLAAAADKALYHARTLAQLKKAA
ncbi:hypothetical protein [Micromonospora sp. NPDC047730]|uniref:hypothetical protein n=1 Tax=Micromonospora sp. NPDC047730 TaxID=3364253 RepID=UPI0037151F30